LAALFALLLLALAYVFPPDLWLDGQEPRFIRSLLIVVFLMMSLAASRKSLPSMAGQLAIWAITVGSSMARATPGAGNEGPMSSLVKLGDIRLIHAGDDARFALEARGVTIEDLRMAADALDALPERASDAMERLQRLCLARGVA